MTSCSSMEMTRAGMETTNAFSRVYATTYNVFTVCMVCYIVIGTYCIVRWAKMRFKQVYGDIRDQQEEIMGYTQAKLDQFIEKYYDVLNKHADDNANLRDCVADIETRVIYLQSIVPSEVTMRRIHDDANANYANLGERIHSLRYQTSRNIQELEEKYSVINRHLQMDDESGQVLIGYVNHKLNERHMGVPVFCPKNTTNFDKYLGNHALLVLDSLAQLPNYKEFNFTKYYYKDNEPAQSKPVSRFIDMEGNVIADTIGRTLKESENVQWIKDHYVNEFKKAQDYCKKFGVNCI
jgi:hypothetical protein